MKSILHVIDSIEPGGAEAVFVQLADELRDRGYRSVAVVAGLGWAEQELQLRGIVPSIVPSKGSFNWSLLWSLIRIIRREKISVIQSHLLGSNVYCAAAGALTNTPVIATFHGMVDVGEEERMRTLKLAILNAGVSQYVAVSTKLLNAIYARGLLSKNKASVIYNGVDVSRYKKSASTSVREMLKLPTDSILVGSVGNLHPAKGYEYLIEAAALIRERNQKVHFVVAGECKPTIYKSLMEMSQKLGVLSSVHFVGFVENSADFLGQMNYFVLPSLSEGFSIATVEAMATGLPVVATQSGGPEEIIEDGKTGLLVPPKNSLALSEALLKFISQRDFAEKIATHGRLSVSARFSKRSMVDQYVSLYERYCN